MVERYTLLKFARNEYFHSLKKLMFQEKIVFKLLAYRLEYEKSKLESRKLNGNDGENGQFQSLSPEEISPGFFLTILCFFLVFISFFFRILSFFLFIKFLWGKNRC